MQDSDSLAEFGRLGVTRLSAVLRAKEKELDGTVHALFYQTGELAALSIIEPGRMSLPILLFALGEVARDLADHNGKTRDFDLFAKVLGSLSNRWARMRASMFVQPGGEIGVNALALVSDVHALLSSALEIAGSVENLSCHHIVAAIDEMPQSVVDQAIEVIGCNPDAFEDLVSKQLASVRRANFSALRPEIQPLPSVEAGASDTVALGDFADAEIRRPGSESSEKSDAGSRREEVNTELSLDDPEDEHDDFGRSVLAIGLARRLHHIWCRTNKVDGKQKSGQNRSSFVLHLDAPWGGGKTTFAHFIANTLNPRSNGRKPAKFLRDRYGKADLGGIFLADPPAGSPEPSLQLNPPDSDRRPWVTVSFNAWQAEHCSPPWWVFYQTIRSQCFRAVRREGQRPWVPHGRSEVCVARLGYWCLRHLSWLNLWFGELAFRITIPKIRGLLSTAAISLLMLVLLEKFGVWGLTKDSKGALTSGFLLASGVGLLLAGVTGIGALWGLGAVLTEAIMPDSDPLAEKIGLGKGDPFQRFTDHFAKTMRRVERPVLVIVDDLDRCGPAFVVDLVRGIQTVLRSPRVVFLILGDKEWIETAFEVHYAAMNAVDVGPEQSLGARFVEKAIQMSFILPTPSDEDRAAYLRGVLLGEARPDDDIVDPDQTSRLRDFTNRLTVPGGDSPIESSAVVAKAMAEFKPGKSSASGASDERVRAQYEQIVNDTLAINVTVNARVQSEIYHQLEALAGCFPANPRQVKRIVNAITIYYAVALQRPGLEPDAPFRRQLTLWIILMTEWPESWRLLASCPDLIGIIKAEDPGAEFDNLELASRPGTRDGTLEMVARFATDPTLRSLILGDGQGREGLTVSMARVLAQLTPLHHRQPRLLASGKT